MTPLLESSTMTKNRVTLLVHSKMNRILKSIVTMFADGLADIGTVPFVANELNTGIPTRAIIFGANFFNVAQLKPLERNSIVFNVENIQSNFMSDEYCNLLRNYHVWDYSATNAKELAIRLGRPVQYAKLFYVDKLLRIPRNASKDIDVLFYGSFNARRSAILDQLSARGLQVTAVFEVFGAELDDLIARAKVVINIHYYGNGHLELIRLFDLLINGCAVVSELNPGEHLDDDLSNALVVAPYDQLVETTEALLRDPARREAVAADGLRTFSRRTANAILRTLLANSESSVIPASIVVGSGKSYDPSALNIDIGENWNPDIVADISDTQLFGRDYCSSRFGAIRMQKGWFDAISASHVLEHILDLTQGMANIRDLLTVGGTLHVTVPYDLSYGAWQDPTHVHAFNERSWLYYCEWNWYLGWTESRFDLIAINFGYSDLGKSLATRDMPRDEILRTPRAVDEMHAVLRKRLLTDKEREYGRAMRGEGRVAPRNLP